ncbi:MAG: methionyl-tRNA formyltransferase [Flavobacteriales bacterium]|jgi:methionyl-tRNA formyltransferase|nr:methionyl-tRNA formyltransferase [Flavobacteriales bacterium]
MTEKKGLRIVFMGTPDFASYILEKMIEENHQIVGVVTPPDKPAGRGMKLQSSAVKKVAVEHGLELAQPEKLKNEEFIDQLQQWNADIFVVIAFRMLPKIVWSIPSKGTFNLHGSLLPHYRGAAPIHWAVINGEKETGVTTFFIDEKIDTGAIIDYKKCAIEEKDTVGSVYSKLMKLGGELVLETLDKIINDEVNTRNQHELFEDENQLKHAPKIFKKTCEINFDRPVEIVYNHIRGLNPFPGAFAKLTAEDFKKQIKFFNCRFEKRAIEGSIGSFYHHQKEIHINCKDGVIIVDELQLEGKKRMKAKDFISGFNWEKKYQFIYEQ